MLTLDYCALSLLFVSTLTGVSCEDLSPVQTEDFSSQGTTVTLSYNYAKNATGRLIAGDTITPEGREVSGQEGQRVSLSCQYETSEDYVALYWYRHDSDLQAPQFILWKGGKLGTEKGIFFTGCESEKEEINKELKQAIKTAKLRFKNKVEQTFTKGNLLSAWQALKNMAAVNSGAANHRTIWDTGSSSTSLANDLNSFYTRSESDNSTQRGDTISSLKPGVSCEDLSPVQTEDFSSQGTTVTLSYTFLKKGTDLYYFFWYRQYPGKPPEFLISHLGTQNKTESGLGTTLFICCLFGFNSSKDMLLYLFLLLSHFIEYTEYLQSEA
ncbi:hypothetical protein INR49_027202 [Caranx melampygus]|nr:hypothetical protein INR49_027202 [Caranx melampygus]